jgi:nucleoside-diphosphate-sugar epimerase
LDVRSLRYPGLISYTAPPGGGTTDYAVHIFYEALKHKHYTCFLKENTTLPMMYMPDAVRATLELMATDASQIKVRSSYNIAGVSFSPKELVAEIQKNLPDFTCDYSPDFRQDIAANWPQVMLDNEARSDWGWKPAYRLAEIAADMLARVPVAKTI